MPKKNKKQILLIEDDSAIIDVYQSAFNASGIDAEVITLGKQAIEKIKKIQQGEAEKPSLVLLDLILPDINGMEILKEIRKNDTTKNIVVFVTSNYTSEELNHDEDAKPDKFILKTNITPAELVKLIKGVIN